MNNEIEKELKELQIQYDKVLKERNELSRKYDILKKDLLYLQEQNVKIFIFPDGRKMLGIDINDIPSEAEKVKKLEDIINNIMEELKNEQS